VANSYYNQAKNSFLKKDYLESRNSLQLFQQYADSVEIPYGLRVDAIGLAVEVEEMLGSYRTANSYMKQLVELKDSIFREDKSREIGRLESQFELDKANYDNELKEQELQIKDAAIKQQRLQRNALIVGLLLLSLLAFFAVRGQRAKTRLNQKLRQVEEIKTRWFVNVSHELKTPLTLIQGPINQLMKSESINEVDKSKLILADRNVKSLQSLVLEILDLSKLEKGVLELDSKPVDLSALIKSTVASFESLASSNKIGLSEISRDEYWMKVDPHKIRKLLENLISNALKFTPPAGDVQVEMKFDNDYTRIVVSDTGEGIADEDLLHVFERFYQSSDKQKNRIGGTGVGLSLAKEVAIMHGGDLIVTSQEGKGSVFTLLLPSGLQTTAETYEEIEVEDGDVFVEERYRVRLDDRPKLLLVEDNMDMQTYIQSILKDDYIIDTARDGREGLDFLQKGTYDLIISDVMMPRMDGLTFSQKVKENEKWSRIPFVMLTALNSDSDRIYALRIGIDDYLAKPFVEEELAVRLKNLLANRQQRLEIENEDQLESFDDRILKTLESEVKQHLMDTMLSVSYLADKVAMSESSLRRYLKKSTGLSPLEFINELKLQHALKLLEKGVYSTIKEVALNSGYDRTSRFTPSFQKRFGKHPGDYLT